MTDLLKVAARHSSDVILAALVALVAFDYEALPAVLLATKLNVFVLPVATTTSVFDFPLWVWYILSIRWIGQALVRFNIDRDDLSSLKTRVWPSRRHALTDGGDE